MTKNASIKENESPTIITALVLWYSNVIYTSNRHAHSTHGTEKLISIFNTYSLQLHIHVTMGNMQPNVFIFDQQYF